MPGPSPTGSPPTGPPPSGRALNSRPSGGAGRRRDRHGRGLRGPLAPREVPISRGGAARFDDFVLDAVEHLERRWSAELAAVEFAVEDVPPVPEDGPATRGDPVPLGRVLPADAQGHPRVVLYRRPIEARAFDRDELGALVHDVVVEQVAALLGLEPEAVDPDWGGAE